jgi:hypothetical protein
VAEYTDEQLLDGIERAVQARDMDAAAALIRRLAVQAPAKAQAILDAVVNGTVTVTVSLRDALD